MKNNKKIINMAKIILFSLVLAAGFFYLRKSKVSNLKELKRIILDSGCIAPLIYICLFTILPSFFFPVTVLAMAAGYVFEIIPASIYAFIGVFLNSTLTYCIGKYVAYDFTNDVANEKYYSKDSN